MAQRYWVGGGSSTNWVATGPTNWSATSGGANDASVPTSSDDVILDTNSGSGTSRVSAPITINSFDATNSTNTFAGGGLLTILTSATFGAGMNITNTGGIALTGTGTLTMNGLSITTAFPVTINGGVVTLTDALSLGVTSVLTLTSGTFDVNNKDVTVGSFSSNNSNTRMLTMGSGLWTLTGNANPWDVDTTSLLTINAGASTIKLTGTLTATRTFAGGGRTYNNFWNATTGAFAVLISGSNTFNNFRIDAGRTQQFTAGTVTYLTSMLATGAGTTITSDSAAQHTLSSASTISVQNCTISYSFVTGGGAWIQNWQAYTSLGNVDGGNNRGWLFTAPAVLGMIFEPKEGQVDWANADQTWNNQQGTWDVPVVTNDATNLTMEVESKDNLISSTQ